jgi:hypothetical protein
MPKVEKIPPKPSKKISYKVSDTISIDLERLGDAYRSYYNNKKISEVKGSFVEWCFSVEEYNICFSKDELEAMLGER